MLITYKIAAFKTLQKFKQLGAFAHILELIWMLKSNKKSKDGWHIKKWPLSFECAI
jgi:hypothetical protein